MDPGKEKGIEYVHEEFDIVDYNAQRILPHKLTQNGPCLAAADMNGDGMEDFIVGSSAGYSPQLFFQDVTGNFSQTPLFKDKEDMNSEEEGISFFDLVLRSVSADLNFSRFFISAFTGASDAEGLLRITFI